MQDPIADAYPLPNVFEAMLAPENMRAAWEKNRKNGGCAGGDGVTIGMFAASLEDNLDRLVTEIRGGTYQPRSHERKAIPKKRGGTRILSIPSVVDRVAQGALARVLRPLFEAEFEDCSYAYRPGRSVDMAARAVTALWQEGHEWVVEADIRAYFDNVPHAPLLDILSSLVPEGRVLGLVERWLAAGGQDPTASGNPGAGIGLPQGGPMAPYLANLYLDEMDERLQDAGFRLVRYADDFLLLARSYESARRGMTLAANELARLGLFLNPEKTRISRFSDGFDFLGRRFLRDHLTEDPDGLDAEERAAVTRWGKAEARAESAGIRPEPARVSRLYDKEFNTLRASDMLAPKGPDAPLVIADGTAPADTWADFVDDATLFIQREGAVLQARGGVLSVLSEGREHWARAPNGLDRIEVAPGVVVSDAALRLAASKGLPIYWVSHAGITISRTQAPLADRAGLHLDQARMALDPVEGLALARILAEGRILSARQVMMGWRQDLKRKARQARKSTTRERAATLLEHADSAVQPMLVASKKCRVATDRASLLGLEGSAIARFYRFWRRSLLHVSIGARSRRPALDAGNAVLNYLTSLLQRDVEMAIRRAGLHPGIGIYHSTRDYADALVFDLMEEFRAPVVEALARRLLNNRDLEAEDFHKDLETGAVRLTPQARRTTIAAYRHHVARRNRGSGNEGKQGKSWRGLMHDQARSFSKTVSGQSTYVPILRGY
ncbi:CRISPR-associated endonuclease Cas1 [Sedimentitalea todarodis]|uniref:CRISPR-associated endonuclease Cas1 n=1 Tax=Sedimentitalea todarodis TaxID=1631240 RepID=A0ABU3VFK1_9RHOB|nr:CRISPR-associated endonuclease Cas1 [Sedimentitalea todarodis]MDU9004484.1 CRISPR-associated endonuclease Cas1 [Sedimentitalea todarodis]